MILKTSISRLIRRAVARAKDETGAAMVEFAIVMGLFFFVFFGIIDFGRLMWSVVHAEKASQIAIRMAVTRPAACANVPTTTDRFDVNAIFQPRFGASCDAFLPTKVCQEITVSCSGDATNATALTIWNRIEPLLPPGSTIDMLKFEYRSDPRLGFLGGPFTPQVTVSLALDPFEFVAPIARLGAFAAGTTSTATGNTINYPNFSVSLPAEDLTHGLGS